MGFEDLRQRKKPGIRRRIPNNENRVLWREGVCYGTPTIRELKNTITRGHYFELCRPLYSGSAPTELRLFEGGP